MKEVRLNDKMWFGKYKDLSIKDIIARDRMYMDSLVLSGKIKYSEKVEKYANEKNGEKSFTNSIWARRYADWTPTFLQRQDVTPTQNEEV